MVRAAVAVLVMRPTAPGTLTLLAGLLKFAWFGRLKNSTRKDERSRSVMAVFLKIPESQATKPGPNSALRAVFPNVKGWGVLNASGANQRSMERSLGVATA